jgi:hypothetical protein
MTDGSTSTPALPIQSPPARNAAHFKLFTEVKMPLEKILGRGKLEATLRGANRKSMIVLPFSQRAIKVKRHVSVAS